MSEKSPSPRQQLAKYQIIQELARGGMGVVYKGFDPHIERIVAIKTIHQHLLEQSSGGKLLERFKREAQAAGRLTHPNVVMVYDYGEHRGTPYIAMEFVEGRSLEDYLKNDVRFTLELVVRIMTQILDALDYCHANGVVHRDLKPGNVILVGDSKVKIADFGIARIEASHLTQTGAVLGTPSYMSPEQFMGQTVDARSDLFSAGAILYELLTGEKAFPGNAMVTVMHKVVNVPPDDPSRINVHIPASFDRLTRKALAKRPDLRFQTASAFAEALMLASRDDYHEELGGEEQTALGAGSRPAGVSPDSAMALRDATFGAGTVADPDATVVARPGEATQPSARAFGAPLPVPDGAGSGSSVSAGLTRGRWLAAGAAGLAALALAGWFAFQALDGERRPPAPAATLDAEAPAEARHDVGVSVTRVQREDGGYYGLIKAVTVPSGAALFLEGEYFGVTPFDFELPPGAYQVRVEKQGYRAEDLELAVEPTNLIQLTVGLAAD